MDTTHRADKYDRAFEPCENMAFANPYDLDSFCRMPLRVPIVNRLHTTVQFNLLTDQFNGVNPPPLVDNDR